MPVAQSPIVFYLLGVVVACVLMYFIIDRVKKS
jgi:hypothetical protein